MALVAAAAVDGAAVSPRAQREVAAALAVAAVVSLVAQRVAGKRALFVIVVTKHGPWNTV